LTPCIEIAGRPIGAGQAPYIIAEMSANHGGSLEHAIRLVREVAAAGADAVKLQTYTADTLTLDSDAPAFRISSDGPWNGRTLYDLYTEAAMPWEWQPRLKKVADDLGLTLFSSVFDDTSVSFLEEMGIPAFKVASSELIDIPLLRRVARTGKPVLVSTGMGTLAEIDDAVRAVREVDPNVPLALLKCTAAYPASAGMLNLATIPDLAQRYGVPVGLSDHTLGTVAAVAGVAHGAAIIEKHVCLSRADGGPDAHFSIEPDELRRLVADARTASLAQGVVTYGPDDGERETLAFRRSLFIVDDVASGEMLTSNNVRAIRPAGGLAPRHIDALLGRRVRCKLTRGTPLTWELLEEESTASKEVSRAHDNPGLDR
jgi:pseudaminic acid synthase